MNRRHFIIPVFVPHIGCPHNCVFCNQNTITGKKRNLLVEDITAKSAENIIDEHLKTINMHDGEKVVEVSFFGGTFTAIPVTKQIELLQVAYKYKIQGTIQHIRLSTRPDYIDHEELQLLQRFGVDIIELGVQSLDEEVLKKSGRGHTAKDVYKACNLIREYNFTLGIQIMLGLPGDDFEKDIKTTENICAIKPDLCRIYPALVIKDTPMEHMLNRGEYTPYTLEEAIEICSFVLSMLITSNINVIRVGLQPTEDINENAQVIAGPFHAAFKELVESYIMNEAIYNHLKDLCEKNVEIVINPKNISKLYSNKKYYFKVYRDKLQVNYDVLQNWEISMDEIILKYGKEQVILSIKESMAKKVSCISCRNEEQ
ncbi:Histone acetyltransferase, component of the RNA polymerase elongator complex [Hathewaya proteolytica DSM 3090]|uniref:Histone acetyltransferase, component of the RNA polymerase elongator complex n=1 Tax=Hathewaya proteolytica DSM 3090 TaxID=1121331 RepID=A0A1M6J8I6_9CLOT|nr:radical SAM protein [Hathewaya proteolytica]SHJ42995.1 Histone acetyltransferase, component of the RNA polymerase elongator complex [Hathewaya proteolytica DSM 3090]